MSPSASTSRTTGNGRMELRKRRKLNEATAPAVTQDDDRFMRLKVDLLPGIPNEVTLEHITTKLPWRTSPTLSSVSRAWRQAIQDRLIFYARVRRCITETVVVINHTQLSVSSSGHDINAISVYSLRDKVCHQLPPIPEVQSGIPWECQCAILDGKVYVLGGTTERTSNDNETRQLGSKEVYVLDLAGQQQWKQCARMQEARHKFGCGVLDGKIYVFGGTSLHTAVRGSEMYDPNVDAWSAISRMRRMLFDSKVLTVGDELLVYGGDFYAPRYRNGTRFNIRRPACGMRAYHPATGKWRILSKDFGTQFVLSFYDDRYFVTQGKVHSTSGLGVDVYNFETNSWKKLQSIWCPGQIVIFPVSVVAVEDELLAAIIMYTSRGSQFAGLAQSRGFNRENEQIVWENLPFSPSMKICPNPIMYPLRL